MPEKEITLSMKGISKSFGGSHALQNVAFELRAREIHGLLGGNGAGKTTLMNVLFGLYRADHGEIELFGKTVHIKSPGDAIHQGIGMVHQHFLQIPSFTVLQNVVLGTRVDKRWTMDLSQERKKLIELGEKFGLQVKLDELVQNLPMGVRQKVEILKALYRGVRILILDEPTTNLTPQEVDSLFHSLRIMVDQGMSIVFITHKLKEVLAVCDRITVLRQGKNVLTMNRDASSEEAFVRAMVGEEMDITSSIIFSSAKLEEMARPTKVEALRLENVKLNRDGNVEILKNICMCVHRGEILGVAGVADNGQRELAEVILGIQKMHGGKIILDEMDVTGETSRVLLEKAIAYIPEDSLHDGFLPKANVAQNLILGYHRQSPYSYRNFMNWSHIYAITHRLIREFNIKTGGPKETGANLSGGNIQRVMIARAFSKPANLLIAHNPTRGLDIPSIDFVYNRLLERKKAGMGTLLISENLDELLLLSDRIAVIFCGEIRGILPREKFEKYEIGRMMSGVHSELQ